MRAKMEGGGIYCGKRLFMIRRSEIRGGKIIKKKKGEKGVDRLPNVSAADRSCGGRANTGEL